jgi:hypothetical protein
MPCSHSQQAGPKLATYSAGNATIPASIHFANRSRRLTIRTVSQTQNAANATPMVGRTSFMPGIVAAGPVDPEGELIGAIARGGRGESNCASPS